MPVTVTRYEYDDDGRLSRSFSVTESEWSPDEVALLTHSRVHDRDIGAHGIPMSEATDPDNQFGFTAGRVMDWAEKTRLDAIADLRESSPKANLNGLMFPVRRRV